MDIDEDETIAEATDRSIRAATHLSEVDAGAVQMLRGLANTVDEILANGLITASGKFDNVTIPVYLKFCESLGLTPGGRGMEFEKPKAGAGGKLAQLRLVQQKAKPAASS